MIIKRVLSILSLSLISFGLMAATPYATINYAEGSSFLLIRDGKSSKILVDAPEVLGMELKSGDILQTSASTFLEISIKSIAAIVQVAENTSFKCSVDSSGVQVTGELYYGRVRAKVTKLAGTSAFHISTPSLVAGVRGTNFGCDAIATRPQNVMVITNRVFCFEGSVTVDDALKAVPDTILISPNEMVEKTVAQQQPVSMQLQKTAINPEIGAFWDEHPLSGTKAADVPVVAEPVSAPVPAAMPAAVAPVAAPVPDYTVLDHKWPEGRKETKSASNARIPTIAAIAFVAIGMTSCVAAGYYQSKSGESNVLKSDGFKLGLVLLGTGSLCALIAAILH